MRIPESSAIQSSQSGLLARLLYQPYAIVVPWAGLACLLAAVWGGLHLWVVDHYRDRREALEQARMDARTLVSHHSEIRQARKDMARVLAMLPSQRDFAPLALGVTEQAKAHHVSLPGLTYQLEKTDLPDVFRAVLEGDISGRYEDLRRFIEHLETADELVLIEHLDVDRARQQDANMTINLRVATYLRTPRMAAKS